MPTFTIAGQSGSAWNETAQTPEALGVSGASLTGGTLGEDEMSISLSTGATAPAKHQRVSLLRDSSVVFRGWVTAARRRWLPESERLEVKISGPHYWLRKTAITSTTQHQRFESAAERPELVFASGQTLAQNVTALLGLYNAKWAEGDARRITVGTIAASYALPRLRLTGGNFLAALEDLLSWVPDAQALFQYTAAAFTLHIARRGTMENVSLALGFSGSGPWVREANVNPRWDLENTEGVSIDYCEVVDDQTSATGQTRYLSQTSSGATTARIRVVTAGPELDTFMPPTPTENEVVQSATIGWELFRDNDPNISAIPGIEDGGLGAYLSAITAASEEPGKTITSSHDYYLKQGTPKEWWERVLPDLDPIRASVSATLTLERYGVNLTQTGTYPWGSYQHHLTGTSFETRALTQEQWHFFQFAAVSVQIVDMDESAGGYYAAQLYTARYVAQASAVVVAQNVGPLTIYRRPDFQYYTPPASLAANLFAAQAWVPYEGQVSVVSDDTLGTGFAGRTLTITGGPAEWASMAAMVIRHEVDILSGVETLTLGAPTAAPHRALTDRIWTNGKANIRYL